MVRRRVIATTAVLGLAITSLQAVDLTSLATLAVQGAVLPLARDFEREHGHRITFVFDTGPNLARRVGAGESADVLIAPAAVVAQALTDGRVVAGTPADIGRVAVGVAIPRGAARPDLGSVDAFKAALLRADAVVYSQGTSGVYIEQLFRQLGVTDAIAGKLVRLPNGGAAMERIASSRANDIGFTMVSEIRMFEDRGVVLAGMLPAAIQNYTTYTAAVLTGSPNRTAAQAFVRHLTTPAARTMLVSTGWER